MSRTLQIARPTTPLHLYRHLLREASYLPPFARPFVDDRIKDRFRHSQHREDVKTPLRQANHNLRLLRAANAGDLERMRRVLDMCFGRIGPRRRELMTALLTPDVPVDTESVEKYAQEALAHRPIDRERDWLDNWDLAKLKAFATSQAKANPPRSSLHIKQLQALAGLPKENIWGNPLSPKVARTKLKKFWKQMAVRILPPLPLSEWELLRDLSTGKGISSQWTTPHRRTLAQSLSGDCEALRPWNWQAYATKAVRVVDRQAGRKHKLLSGALDDSTPTGDPQPLGCHRYTRSLWRRLLEGVFCTSSTMRKDGEGWDVVWGGKSFQPPVADMEFFESADESGRPPERKRKRKRGEPISP